MTHSNPPFLEPDARRRVALGALARHDRYIATIDDNDVITLTPAVVMPLATARETFAAIDREIDDVIAARSAAGQRGTRTRPDRSDAA